jgi:hypothetical protein
MEAERSSIVIAHERRRGAETAHGKSPEPEAIVLTWSVGGRTLQLDGQAADIRRQPVDTDEGAGGCGDRGKIIVVNARVREDPSLACMKNPGLGRFSSQQLSMLDPNETTPALPGAAVVGHANALLKRRIQQDFTWIGAEGRGIRGDGEFSSHPGFPFCL